MVAAARTAAPREGSRVEVEGSMVEVVQVEVARGQAWEAAATVVVATAAAAAVLRLAGTGA